MNDTPQHIKELQLKIWLSKSPGERLKQFMEDNASLFQFWKAAKKEDKKASESPAKRKSSDFIMDFFSGNGRPAGLCRVRIFGSNKQDKTVIITDIGDLNTGASVTNSIKSIATKLISEGLIDNSTYIIEHYEPGPVNNHTFDIVTFDHNMLPSWESSTIEQVCERLKINEDEIITLVEDDKTLMKEIIIQTKLILNHKETLRKSKQKDYKIYKQEIKTLIENHAQERELQAMLKSDLSLLAEVYADPKDEYICFSEFPIGKRKADFVLFTGRSKMCVFIIEIKGADFFFTNKGAYKKINEKITTCRHQIIEGISELNGQYYDEFREFCHKVRLDVEKGNSLYNSLLGPKKYLHVDDIKEIKTFGVVIGGRTRDDLYESNIRHHEEILTPKIRIESWDSWLNKLVRPESPL